jgi:hypothetical protein
MVQTTEPTAYELSTRHLKSIRRVGSKKKPVEELHASTERATGNGTFQIIALGMLKQQGHT